MTGERTPGNNDSITQVIHDQLFLDQLSSVYCEVFLYNDPPEVHDPLEVRERFIHEMTLPGTYPYFCRYPREGNDIDGFMWGFAAPYEQHLDYVMATYFSHYPEDKQEELKQGVTHTLSSLKRPIQHINFVSEYGIVSGKRGGEIFPNLLQDMLDQQLRRNVTVDVSWSRKNFGMYTIVQTLDGIDVSLTGEAIDDRVVLICDLLRIQDILGDDPVKNYRMNLRRKLVERKRQEG